MPGEKPSTGKQFAKIVNNLGTVFYVSASESGQADTDDDLSTHTLSDEISTAKLRWIMASVWIGTFCAGLGTPYRVHSRLGQSSENKSVKDY